MKLSNSFVGEISYKASISSKRSSGPFLICYNSTTKSNKASKSQSDIEAYVEVLETYISSSINFNDCNAVDEYLIDYKTDKLYGGVVFDQFDVENEVFSFTLLYNSSISQLESATSSGNDGAPDYSLIVMNQIVQSSLQEYLTGEKHYNKTIFSDGTFFYEETVLNYFSDFLTTQPFLLSSAVTFLIPFFVYFATYEKEKGMKLLLEMSCGVTTITYWISRLFSDGFMCFFVLFCEYLCMGFIGREEAYTSNLLPSLFFHIAYSPLLLLFSYSISLLFKKSEDAVNYTTILISLLIGLSYMIFGFVLNYNVPSLLNLVLSIVPVYSFYYSLVVLGLSSRDKKPISITDMIYFKNYGRDAMIVLLIMVVESFVLFGIIISIELISYYKKRPASERQRMNPKNLLFLRKKQQKSSQSSYRELNNIQIVEHTDDSEATVEKIEIKEEKERIQVSKEDDNDDGEVVKSSESSSSSSKQVLLEINNVHKTYKGKKLDNYVIRGVDLKVHEGEIYTLLGPNGSGKSTLLSICAGILGADFGKLKINSYDIFKNSRKAHKYLGICPQENLFWENVSVKNHLRIFRMIRSCSGSGSFKVFLKNLWKVNESVDLIIRNYELHDHAKKKVKILSGGNKRKLQIALSVIGTPPKSLILLDEPTTGIDVGSRQFIWDRLKEMKKHRGVVWTTHSMEEAENVSSRIGILVNGKKQCEGTTQQLKDMYGQSYKLNAMLETIEDRKNFEKFVENAFQEKNKCKRISSVGRNTYFQIDVNEKYPLHEIFRVIEEKRQDLKIIDFTLSQTSLSQVFLNFARIQEDTFL